MSELLNQYLILHWNLLKTICLQGLRTQNSEPIARTLQNYTTHLSTVKIYPYTSNNKETTESRSNNYTMKTSTSELIHHTYSKFPESLFFFSD